MIDKKDFSSIRIELRKAEALREEAITRSREIIKLSKQAIYALHRDDITNAKKLTAGMAAKVKILQKKDNRVGMCRVAYQEYVEAASYLHFIQTGKLITRKACGVDTESYLLGLCDLTGELMRKAVNEVIGKNEGAVYIIRELISEIYGQILKLDLRNSELRKKSDAIKWNLTKVEDIIYTLELRNDRTE